MNKLFITSILILFVFSFFGVVMTGNIIHENSHKLDFRNIATNGTICLLEWGDGAVASYNFYHNNDSEYERINKYTEYKAYSLNIGLYLIFLICLSIVLYHWGNLKIEMERNKYEG